MMAKKKSNVIVVRSCSSPTISMSPSSTIRRSTGTGPGVSVSVLGINVDFAFTLNYLYSRYGMLGPNPVLCKSEWSVVN